MPSPSPISALTVQPARSTVGAALRPLPGFGVNRDFFFLVVSQYPVSIDSYPIKHRGHAGLSLGLMSPLFDGEPFKAVKCPIWLRQKFILGTLNHWVVGSIPTGASASIQVTYDLNVRGEFI